MRFYNSYCPLNPSLRASIAAKFDLSNLKVRHLYYSEKSDVADSVGGSAPLHILTRAQARYFSSLVDTIERSAKYEILKYLGVALNQSVTHVSPVAAWSPIRSRRSLCLQRIRATRMALPWCRSTPILCH